MEGDDLNVYPHRHVDGSIFSGFYRRNAGEIKMISGKCMQDYVEVTVVKNSNITEKIGIPTTLKVLKDKESVTKNERVFRIMTPKDGDKRIVWDSRDLAQIQDAKEMFDECIAKGLVPYMVGTDGRSTSEVMDEFDPEAEEVIFLPIAQVAGG